MYLISSFPSPYGLNPYIESYFQAILDKGFTYGSEFSLDSEWLSKEFNTSDAIHLNWPEILWHEYDLRLPDNFHSKLRHKVPGFWRISDWLDKRRSRQFANRDVGLITMWVGLAVFMRRLHRAHKYGKKVIWTVHNLEAHEGMKFVDRFGYWLLSKLTDLAILHDERAASRYRDHYKPKGRVVVMAHGNYDGAYPAPRTKAIVLEELGLSADCPLVTCLGAIRDYKGLDVACEAVQALGDEVQFLCAGNPHEAFDISALKERISRLPNAKLIPRRLTPQEFSDFASISDVILLPYRKITGSGALLAALTFSKPVVASDLPYFHDILDGHPEAGILVEKESSIALAEGITALLRVPREVREREARGVADLYDWDKVVEPVVEVLETWREEKLNRTAISQ